MHLPPGYTPALDSLPFQMPELLTWVRAVTFSEDQVSWTSKNACVHRDKGLKYYDVF